MRLKVCAKNPPKIPPPLFLAVLGGGGFTPRYCSLPGGQLPGVFSKISRTGMEQKYPCTFREGFHLEGGQSSAADTALAVVVVFLFACKLLPFGLFCFSQC